MSEFIDYYDGKARTIRKYLDREAERCGIRPDKKFGDTWEKALAKDLRKRAGVKRSKNQVAVERDNERALFPQNSQDGRGIK